MKFSSTSLAAVLALCSVDTLAFTTLTPYSRGHGHAFGVSRNEAQFQPLFSSTLEKQDTDIAVAHENDDDTLVVSANHVFINGRITEGGLAKAMPNSVLPIIFEEDKLSNHENHDISTNTHDTPFNSSLSHKNENDKDASINNEKIPVSVQGIKMASAATSSLSKLKSKEESMPTTEMQTSEMGSKQMDEKNKSSDSEATFSDRLTNSGVASAAALATAAVNAAVSMKTLEAPDVAKSYISLDTNKELDGDGLPLVYDKDAIEKYWKKEKGALNKRWGYFVGKAVPFLTRLTTLFIKDGKIEEKYIPELSERARIDLQDLGPTFIKAGQMMSVRPDVLPQVS